MAHIVDNKIFQNFIALPEVGWATFFSALLHVGVFIFAVLGLPQIAENNDHFLAPGEMVMNIDLFNPAEIIEETKLDEEKENNKDRSLDIKPVYNNSNSVPVLSRPDPPKKPVEKSREKQKPAEPVVDPTLIKVPPKPLSKPNAPSHKEVKKPTVIKKSKRNITSLLKDLTPGNEVKKAQDQEIVNSNKQSGNSSASGNPVMQMTGSELVALNQGVQQCWNVNAGGRYAENMVVRLRVIVNPDRSVKEVVILDQTRYVSDSHFKSAADAARWALLNPKCSTLNLPLEKYETWKSFIYVFDPGQML